MAREYTRQSFYDLVWSKPITHVAKDFALSDVAIHKICRKHAIPTPPLGWWAKKRAGQSVAQTPLPPTSGEISDRILIAAPEIRSETRTIAEVREEARFRITGLVLTPDGKPHSIIERTISELRKTEPAKNGLIEVRGPGLISCDIGSASIDRARIILSRITEAAAAQGFELLAHERGAHFAGDGETIGFTVTETFKRVKHVLTAAEQEEQDAWEKKRDRERRRPVWDWNYGPPPRHPEWDYVCTGQLGFGMEGVGNYNHPGPRSTFRDAKIQRLDNMAEDISVALAVLAVAKREERYRQAEAERIRLEEKRIREQPLRASYIAERRREALNDILQRLADLDRLRRLLAGLGCSDIGGLPRTNTFIGWANDELKRREEALSSQTLERGFAQERLFGDDDDHAFQSPRWY